MAKDGDGAFQIFWLQILLKIAATAEIVVVCCGLLGTVREQGCLLVGLKFQSQLTHDTLQYAVFHIEGLVCFDGDCVAAQLGEVSGIHQAIADADHVVELAQAALEHAIYTIGAARLLGGANRVSGQVARRNDLQWIAAGELGEPHRDRLGKTLGKCLAIRIVSSGRKR